MDTVSRRWWMLDVRGMASFVFAVLLVLGPGWGSPRFLAIAFGVYALVDAAGTFVFVRGTRGFETKAYIWRGALGLLVGAAALAQSSATMTALWLLVSIWGVGTGALEMVFGSRTWSTVPRALGFMLAGAVSFGFGATAIHFALDGSDLLRGFLAFYAVLNGVAATALGESVHALPGAVRQAA
jgi:uncharacterized membrane protein HdeD (DUF308 family)